MLSTPPQGSRVHTPCCSLCANVRDFYFGICRAPGTNPLWILRDHCTCPDQDECRLQMMLCEPTPGFTEKELMSNLGTSITFLEFSVCRNCAPGLSVPSPLWVLMWWLRKLCWVVPALPGRPRSEDLQPLPLNPRHPTLLSRNSSRYLSSLALVIWRNTDSRHFSDTVILPILRFRFFFPLPPGSLVCLSPAVWRCWWPEGAVGEEEWLARAGSGGGR